MKILIGSAVLGMAVFALTACGSSHVVVTDQAPAGSLTKLPASLVKLIHSIRRDRGVSGKQVVVYGPCSRYRLVKASSGDLVQKTASERKGFYLVVVHGHFVGFSHPAGTKAPRGRIETQVWSATEGVTDTGISDRLPATVFRLHRVAVVALAASSATPPGAQSSAEAVSSSRLILGGRVRCTATVSRSVQAGSPMGVTFAVTNLSDHTVKVLLADGGLWLVVKAADGTTYDTRVPLRNELGGVVLPTPIRAGATRKDPVIGKYLPVRWRGPLRITPGCGQTALPPLTVAVKAPGPPPNDDKAVAEAVAASGHLLDRCRPQ